VCFNPPHPTPDDLAHLEALNIFIHGKEQPPVNEQPKTKRDTRGNLVPQPAYEGWRPTPSRTRLDILSNLIGTVALITFALWLLFGGPH
jgi:hypothetical protein